MSKSQIFQGDALRFSGLPLEFAVSQILTQIDGVQNVLPKGRLYYEAMDQGISKTCETDLWAIHGWTKCHKVDESGLEDEWTEILHELSIECEHRSGEKHWCFFPQASNVVDLSENLFFNEILKNEKAYNLGKLHRIKREFFLKAKIVGDGIELFEKSNSLGNWDKNPESIRDAIRQVLMPVGHLIPNIFIRNFILSYSGQEMAFCTPIIVTSARIHALKEGIGWDELSKCEEINECFSQEKSVICTVCTPTNIESHWRNCVRKFLLELKKNDNDTFVKSVSRFGDPSEDGIVDDISYKIFNGSPKRVIITQIDSLKDTLKEYLQNFEKIINETIQ